jgi:hypothetical protein
MPIAKRKETAAGAAPAERRPWTKTACLAARRWTRSAAEDEAHRWRFHDPATMHIAFRCPHGDHYHVGPSPAACVACSGTGRNSRNGDCGPCKTTGVQVS